MPKSELDCGSIMLPHYSICLENVDESNIILKERESTAVWET